MTEQTGTWLGWVGIVIAIVGFFWLSIWLGIAAMVLGVIGLTTPVKGLNWTAIALGAVAIILGII